MPAWSYENYEAYYCLVTGQCVGMIEAPRDGKVGWFCGEHRGHVIIGSDEPHFAFETAKQIVEAIYAER